MTRPSRIVAVVDTNALFDAFACRDVTEALEEAIAQVGKAAAVIDQKVTYRRQRAKEALLLAMYFNRARATTWSLHSEPVEILTRRVPPEAVKSHGLELAYTTVFLHFIKDYLLRGWTPCMPRLPDGKVKNDADRAYLDFAKKHGKPLVTNEGNTQTGIVDEKLRLKAKKEGVPVFTPREFWAGRIDEATEVERFLRQFKGRAPTYIRSRPLRSQAKTAEAVSYAYGLLRMVLLGEFNQTAMTSAKAAGGPP